MIKKLFSRKSISPVAILMCSLGIIFYCYEYYLRVAPSVMGAELKQTFGLSEAAFGYLAAFFYYAYTPMQIPVGMMMDRFGPRRILTFACFICAVGTYLFAATKEVTLAHVGRFLVGFGSAFAYVGVLKIANVWLPKKYFAMMAGICTALGMLFGAIGGEVSMTYLVARVGWQETVYYSVVAGVLLAAILWLFLRDSQDDRPIDHTKLDQYSIQFSRLNEMLLSREMWLNGIIGCLTFLPISAFAEIWAVSFLESTGMSKVDAALGSSMVFLGFAIGGPIWGLLSDIIQSRRVPLVLGSFISSALLAIAIFFPSSSTVWMFSLLFFAAFFASVEIIIFAVSNDLSRSKVSGTAVAFTNMVVMVGGGILPPVIGEVLDRSMQMVDNLPVISSEDYSIALAILPLSLFIAGILSLILKESYRKQKKLS